MKILIAEDEAIILATLQLRLKREGHEVYAANNGNEALDLFDKHKPDIVITDIMMPFNSGIEILAHAKSVDKSTGVILLSSMGQESMVLEAFSLGADDYITKPFSPNELISRINRLGENRLEKSDA